VELIFAHLDDTRFKDVDLFEPVDFLRMMRLLRLFDVGVDDKGEPLRIPDHLLAAEQEYIGQTKLELSSPAELCSEIENQ